MSEKQVSQGVVLSAMRPTGDLHIGHFEGVLRNWVELQDTHDCYYFVADWHALTTELDTSDLKKHSLSMVRDWLAFGVNPEKSTIFVQSYVPEHAELSVVLERLINIGKMERMPTFKAQLEHLASEKSKEGSSAQDLDTIAKSEVSLGFLAYPVLQAADILLYDTTHVPVGEDQLPHIELTRDLAQKFNRLYGRTFVVPDAMLGEAKRIRGSDGRKMSKSYGNDISPSDDKVTITDHVKKTITNRKMLSDKGDPFECPIYDLHRIFNVDGETAINLACRAAEIKCYDCKMVLPSKIAEAYEMYKERKDKISDDFVKDVLRDGNLKAQEVARRTMGRVRSAMSMAYLSGE